jgi:hypothetical protein
MVNLEGFKRSPSGSIYLEMDAGYTLPSRVTVTYTGEFRQTPFHHMFAIGEWVRPYNPSMTDEDLIAIFKYEGRFIDGLASYWLPIQTNLVQGMQEELKPGDRAVLYLRWIAVTKTQVTMDYIFIVNAWTN